MNIFIFFKIIESLKETKSINYSAEGVDIFLDDFSKVAISQNIGNIKTRHFFLDVQNRHSPLFKKFLVKFFTYEKHLEWTEQEFKDFRTSLKTGYTIFHSIGDTFIIEFPDCNNKCYFCETHSSVKIRKGFGFQNITKGYQFFTKQQPINTVDFFGGEPTIHKDFFPLIDFFAKQGKHLTLATHGRTFINKEIVEKIGAHFEEIRVSFHDSNEQEFEKVTCVKHSYRQTLDGLKNLYEMGTPNIVVNIVVTKQNFDRIQDTIELILSTHPKAIIKVSGLIFSNEQTYEQIYINYPGIEKMYNLVHQTILPYYKKNNILRFEFEKLPLCIFERKIPPNTYKTEKFRNNTYDEICIHCPQKDGCTQLPKIQLEYIKSIKKEQKFFESLKRKFSIS